ncbi:unnamed protein product, partial [Sphagnum balticum]
PVRAPHRIHTSYSIRTTQTLKEKVNQEQTTTAAWILQHPNTNTLGAAAPGGKVRRSSSGDTGTMRASCSGIRRGRNPQKRTVLVSVVAGNGTRSSSEDVPADLWAWRKYGQKPIKGSPYPRGYYRCSSSKGCLARKQVERSHNDPSMLIISYSAEHNHPWPSHRNSLAGSTRVTSSASKLAKGESAADQVACTRSSAATLEKQKSSLSMITQLKAESEEHAALIPCHDHSVEEEEEEEEEEEIAVQSYAESSCNDHVNMLNSLYSSSSMEPSMDEDFFTELEELIPDSSMATFGWSHRSCFLQDQSDDEGVVGSTAVVDPYNLFCWSTTSSVESKALLILTMLCTSSNQKASRRNQYLLTMERSSCMINTCPPLHLLQEKSLNLVCGL